MKMDLMKRSVARAIFREARQLRTKGPDAGNQLPAIYDLCNSVNPRSGGIILQSRADFSRFALSCDKWCVSREYLESRKLREIVPAALATLDNPCAAMAFASRPGFIELRSAGIARCPFELLRCYKYQNTIGKAASKGERDDVTISAVTGYAKEASTELSGENVFAYNIMFRNSGTVPVRILGHHIQFKSSDKELKSGEYQGVSATIPVIHPGEHYVCGSTVAFPDKLTELSVEGSFHIIKEGYRAESFESLPLEKKHAILTTGVETQSVESYTVPLEKTHFFVDVLCDTQPLVDKLVERGANSDAAVEL